jgi:signal transduction histidine kinase
LININNDLLNQIDERFRVEERLRKSQFLYKAVANNFPEGIIGVVNSDFSFAFVDGKELNDQGTKEPGVHTIVITQYAEQLKPSFAGQPVNFEISVNKNFYEVIGTPFADSDLEAKEILIVIRNITKHKKFEEDLLRSLEKEKLLNVLKSRFVTSVSHEFRTPLSTILSSTFLLENYAGPEMETHRRTHLNRIKRSVNNLTEMLDDFLSLGKLEEGKIKVINTEFYIREYLAELINELNPIRKKDQEIRLNFKGEDEMISVDKNLLTNILTNLISNAIKYSTTEGVIEINAEVKSEVLNMSIRDYGMGIPEKEQRYIFRRFFRAQNAVNIQGTGLGLNLVRKYVRLMKGNITFRSSLNVGSTFYVTLPVSVLNNPTTTTPKVYA